jgi:hypothetical protein
MSDADGSNPNILRLINSAQLDGTEGRPALSDQIVEGLKRAQDVATEHNCRAVIVGLVVADAPEKMIWQLHFGDLFDMIALAELAKAAVTKEFIEASD